MWIIPTLTEVSTQWESIIANELFVLQRTTTIKPSLWNNLVGTLQTFFDVKQAPFRILLKTSDRLRGELVPGDKAITVAVASSKKEIDDDWIWLESNIIAQVKNTGDINDLRLMTYKVYKIIEEQVTSQAGKTDEAITDERFRATSRSFRQTFGLPETERLVSCIPFSAVSFRF